MPEKPTNDDQSRLVAVRVNEAEVNALVELMQHERKAGQPTSRGVMPETRAIVKLLSAYIAPPGQCMICGRKADTAGDAWWQIAISLCHTCAKED
jgi:hypothetical protein